MGPGPQIVFLPDGKRLHLQHGPIDLIVGAFGVTSAVRAAFEAAAERFPTILDELCSELDVLRSPVCAGSVRPAGTVALRMHAAVAPFARQTFITPMAAVAGAVADEVLGSMLGAASLARAFVNNGGDIALHLAAGESFAVGLVNRPDRPSLFGRAEIGADTGIRGIATSGWRGRSFSFGIADSATVLAASAAAADAAATVVANAVDLPEHPAIRRAPANSVQDESDLRHRLVTRDVGPLSRLEIETALARGRRCAGHVIAAGLIHAAALNLRGTTVTIHARAPHHAMRAA